MNAFEKIRNELSASYLERDEVVEGLLCALVAGQHVLLLGPPGTAKSELAHELCKRVDDARYFQWLLTRFTTPEELFGPISLKALEQDRYVRVTDGKLPRAHVAFLDEIFKASSSILNTLLAILNERRFDGGDGPAQVPLFSMVGAANELPEDEELHALYDRFLLRYQVGYLKEDFRFLQMLTASAAAERSSVGMADLSAMREKARQVEIPGEVLRDVAELRKRLEDKDVVVSDRRWRHSLDLLRARAALQGRGRVSGDDLGLYAHVLWSDPSERAVVEECLREVAHGHEDEAEKMLYQAREVAENARGPHEDEESADQAAVEALAKLHDLQRRLDTIVAEASARGRAVERVTAFRDEVRGMVRALLAAEQGESDSRH
ncbi:AAA family ATPase [Vulgatibacter sp.]|uniref:AAA family ATPase n=1 Tax=Vulgatibacter sp. TaxID=1971226 RepID=UPI003566F07D